jgi:SAM-dependent methyltransferase
MATDESAATRRATASDERRLGWDERHKAGDFEGRGPNPTLVAALSGLASQGIRPGRALELACGSGTNAVWIASQGWRTTAVDWSPVGLDNGRAKAEAAGVDVEWLERDLFAWSPPARSFDLVVIVYLHFPLHERGPVYERAAAAVAPGGRLVVVGHHRLQEGEGIPGPDPDRLFTPAEIASPLQAADDELELERADVMRHVPPPGHGSIDALIVLRRKDADAVSRRGAAK